MPEQILMLLDYVLLKTLLLFNENNNQRKQVNSLIWEKDEMNKRRVLQRTLWIRL